MFGPVSASAYSVFTCYSFMSVNVEEELNNTFKNSVIEKFKARGGHTFSNACTFLAVNATNELREKQLISTYELFHIPSMQPDARGRSKAYLGSAQAENIHEQPKLVRLSSNGPAINLHF